MKRLSYANVMSTIAVFLALGGVGWAATTLPANSVGTAQIIDKSVGTNDLADKAVTSAKLNPSVLSLFKGQKGDTGAQGLQGPIGPKGDTGDPGGKFIVVAIDSSLGVTQGNSYVVSVGDGNNTPWGDRSRRITFAFDISKCSIAAEARLGSWNGSRWYGEFVNIERVSDLSVDLYTLTQSGAGQTSVRDSVRLGITCPA